jgi:hypothetical protein
MGAEIVRVDPGARLPEQLVHSLLGATVVLLRQEPARDARLIGNDEGREPLRIQAGDGFRGSGKEPDLFGISDVAGILDDRAVAVEENCCDAL